MDDDADVFPADFLRWEEYAEELEQSVNVDDWDEFLWFTEE